MGKPDKPPKASFPPAVAQQTRTPISYAVRTDPLLERGFELPVLFALRIFREGSLTGEISMEPIQKI
jgi:hypothetical protein